VGRRKRNIVCSGSVRGRRMLLVGVGVVGVRCLGDPLHRLGRLQLIGREREGVSVVGVPLSRSTRSSLLQSTKYRRRRKRKAQKWEAEGEEDEDTRCERDRRITQPSSFTSGAGAEKMLREQTRREWRMCSSCLLQSSYLLYFCCCGGVICPAAR
jgi:hypothetical protein